MPTPSRDSGPFDLIRLLDALSTVDYIIVGGVAAALHGSPRLTFDLDIVPEPSDANIGRLAEALDRLDAQVRDPNRSLRVTKQLLADTAASSVGGQLRLRTSWGPLDILWRLHDGRGYAELRPLTEVLSDEERRVCVLAIASLIEIKGAAARPTDLEDISYLELILQRRKDRGSAD
jgi:hypothetical protein